MALCDSREDFAMNTMPGWKKRLFQRFRRSENVGPVAMAITIGLAGGVGAILFRYLIDLAQRLFFDGGSFLLDGSLGSAYVIFLPAVGLLLVSLLVQNFAPEAQGHGVPEVMYAVARQGGRIRPRVVAIKALASAITIGSGGSVGREGPIVQIGSTIGSVLGQFFGLRERRVRLLVACGSAAGIAGTFNAPIAGVLFAMEVILGSFAARSFGLVVISSVTATAVCQAVLGSEPAFPLTHVFSMVSYWELPIYLALGLLAGLIGLFYVRVLYFLETLFDRWTWHYTAKAFIGGLVVGGLGYLGLRFLGGPYLFGVGYDGIGEALRLNSQVSLDWGLGASLTITAMLLLLGLKILSTSLSLAAGGSGGVFAPALFIGAMTGGAFGMAANALFPGVTAPPGAYALVGMGVAFAASAHAPITSILILFEMTKDYKIILPLMLAVVIGHLIASSLMRDSIYTIKLRRRGGLRGKKAQASVLDLVVVADAMCEEKVQVSPDLSAEDLAALLHGDQFDGCSVVQEDRLVGIVTRYDVEQALMSTGLSGKKVSDLMTKNPIVCTPDETLRHVLPRITDQDVGQLPVVSKEDPGQLLGILRRKQIFWAYGELMGEHHRLLDESGLNLDKEADSVQLQLELSPDHPLAFRRLKEIRVPEQVLIVLLRRAGQAQIPRGDTVMEPGDVLSFLTTNAREDALKKWMEKLGGLGKVSP